MLTTITPFYEHPHHSLYISFIDCLISNEKLNLLLSQHHTRDASSTPTTTMTYSFKQVCESFKQQLLKIRNKDSGNEEEEEEDDNLDELELRTLYQSSCIDHTINDNDDHYEQAVKQFLQEHLNGRHMHAKRAQLTNHPLITHGMNDKRRWMLFIRDLSFDCFPIYSAIVHYCQNQNQNQNQNQRDLQSILSLPLEAFNDREQQKDTLFHLACREHTQNLILWLSCIYGQCLSDNDAEAQATNLNSLNLIFATLIRTAIEDQSYPIELFKIRYQWFKNDLRYNTCLFLDESGEMMPTIATVFFCSNVQVAEFLVSELDDSDVINTVVAKVTQYLGRVLAKCSVPVLELLIDRYNISFNDSSMLLEQLITESDTVTTSEELFPKIRMLVERFGATVPDHLLTSVIFPADVARYLVEINNKLVTHVDQSGKTALMNASELGSKDLVEFLISQIGSDVHKKDNQGLTALDYALRWRKVDNISELIKSGAKITRDMNDLFSNPADYTTLLSLLMESGQLDVNNEDLLNTLVMTNPKSYLFMLSQGSKPTDAQFFRILMQDDSHLTSSVLQYATIFDVKNVTDPSTGYSVVTFCIKNRLENNLTHLLQSRRAQAQDWHLFLVPQYFDEYDSQRIIQLLRASGANIDSVDSQGRTLQQVLDYYYMAGNGNDENKQLVKSGSSDACRLQ